MICMIKCALFDLDGTLADTVVGLGRATAYVMEHYGLKPHWTEGDYRRFVGNGARLLLDRAFEHRLSDLELDRALELFVKKYNENLLDNAVLYDGVMESLDAVKSKGIKIGVVTNKPHTSAVTMTDRLFGSGYFGFVTGSVEGKSKKPDAYFANLALASLGCKADRALFFGDSDVDVMTAKNAGIKSVACSWGFRSRESLEAVSPPGK